MPLCNKCGSKLDKNCDCPICDRGYDFYKQGCTKLYDENDPKGAYQLFLDVVTYYPQITEAENAKYLMGKIEKEGTDVADIKPRPSSQPAQQQAPQYQQPQYQVPQYQVPQYQQPQYQVPQYQVPQYQQPQYQVPQYQTPQYQAPQYQASQYQAYRPSASPAPQNNKTIDNEFKITELLKKYKGLLDAGAITEEEYNAKKKEILGI